VIARSQCARVSRNEVCRERLKNSNEQPFGKQLQRTPLLLSAMYSFKHLFRNHLTEISRISTRRSCVMVDLDSE
jgi:hypothetical protein